MLKKLMFAMAMIAIALVGFTSCSSGPDAQMDKLEKMFEKQNELAKEKGYQGKETVLNMMEIIKMTEELQKEANAEGTKWTQEQKDRLNKIVATPVLGRESTMEEVLKQEGFTPSSGSSSSSSSSFGGSGSSNFGGEMGEMPADQAPENSVDAI